MVADPILEIRVRSSPHSRSFHPWFMGVSMAIRSSPQWYNAGSGGSVISRVYVVQQTDRKARASRPCLPAGGDLPGPLINRLWWLAEEECTGS